MFFFIDCWRVSLDVMVFEVLLGGGWDNLKNEDCVRIVFYNYLDCGLIEDGWYFILDNVFVVFEKVS